VPDFSIIRESDDPLALRASIGGQPHIGWYLVFRGEPIAILAMLREVVAEAERELPKHVRPQG
jgi:hypothetical protein